MSRNEKGSFDPVKEPQAQNLPGYAAVDIIRVNHTAVLTEARLEKDMNPSSETTALEGKTRHHEYLAAGKLKGNKAFITGGESVHIWLVSTVFSLTLTLQLWNRSIGGRAFCA